MQDQAVGPGPGVRPAARPARGLRPGRHGPGPRGLHPHRDRMRQARLRRPGGLVRRPRLHRCAGQGAAVGWLRRGPARPGRARRQPSCGPEPRTAASRCCPSSSPARSGPATAGRDDITGPPASMPSRRHRGSTRARASRPCAPAGPTGGRSAPGRRHLPPGRGRPVRQHGVGHARAAAGCSPRRSSPASVSAWGPGRRCSP